MMCDDIKSRMISVSMTIDGLTYIYIVLYCTSAVAVRQPRITKLRRGWLNHIGLATEDYNHTVLVTKCLTCHFKNDLSVLLNRFYGSLHTYVSQCEGPSRAADAGHPDHARSRCHRVVQQVAARPGRPALCPRDNCQAGTPVRRQDIGKAAGGGQGCR